VNKYGENGSGGLLKTTPTSLLILCLILALLVVLSQSPVSADRILAPDYLWDRHIAEKTDPIGMADTHLGIPYRDDGALDNRGYFTTFSQPDRFFDTPGLNCSGLVVSISRFLFDRNWSLEEVTRDRQGNSGPDSPYGKDWDFGWDLILNISEGVPRRVIMPDEQNYPIESADGMTLRGFDLHDPAAWHKVLGKMQPGRVYLGSISRNAREQRNRLLHYHVVLMLPDEKGGVLLYHATRRSQVHRININSQQGLNRFMNQFSGARGDVKKILIVEAVLPNFSPATATDSGSGTPPVESVDKVSRDLEKRSPQASAGEVLPTEKRQPPDSTTTPSQVASNQDSKEDLPPPSQAGPALTKPSGPDLVINHLSGKVFHSFPELVTHIPCFSDNQKKSLKFWFQNRNNMQRSLEIRLRGPHGEALYKGQIPDSARQLSVEYPKDFGKPEWKSAHQGEYLVEMKVDGQQWCADLFEVVAPREAQPKILSVRVPSTVQAGKAFTAIVEAQNMGAESDYGGITVSCPDPAGLKLISAKPGRIFPPGSTILSVTSDRIRSKVPMAERWIEVWGENKSYDLQVQIQAGRPGTYPLYVRCAIRGVNVKSSVILMDPSASDKVDQQGFPVYVHQITVR
jgi:hypothetical protein